MHTTILIDSFEIEVLENLVEVAKGNIAADITGRYVVGSTSEAGSVAGIDDKVVMVAELESVVLASGSDALAYSFHLDAGVAPDNAAYFGVPWHVVACHS